MIEEELTLKEPKHLIKYIFRFWIIVGSWVMYKEFKEYYDDLKQPIDGVDYS